MFDWNVWISLVNAQRLIGGTCSVTLSLLASRLSRITELRQSRWKCLGEGVRVKRGDSQSLLKIIYIFPFSCSIRIEQTLIRVDLEMRSNTIVISIFRTSDELPYGERQFAVSAACSVSLNHPTTSQRNWIEFKIPESRIDLNILFRCPSQVAHLLVRPWPSENRSSSFYSIARVMSLILLDQPCSLRKISS